MFLGHPRLLSRSIYVGTTYPSCRPALAARMPSPLLSFLPQSVLALIRLCLVFLLVPAQAHQPAPANRMLGLLLSLLTARTASVYIPYTYDRITYPPQFSTDVADTMLSSSTYHGSSESSYDSR